MEVESSELTRARSKLAEQDWKGAYKALDNARYVSDPDFRVRKAVVAAARDLASRTDDAKISQKAADLADGIERLVQQQESGAVSVAEARQAAYEARTAVEGAKRYKVLTQKDRFFAGKFDPEKLEGAINAYAEQGWRVVSMATASIPGGLNTHREEIIILMTREPGSTNGG
jgi:hypothetical protein